MTDSMAQSHRLGRADVDAWIAASHGVLPPDESIGDELSASELEEARRFRFDVHRRRFLATRLFRRRVLAHYLGVRPKEIAFRYGPKGKPALAGELGRGLSFNDADTDGLAVIAVARGRSVGVDVERLRPVPDAQSIISGFGSSLEADSFASIGPAEREEAFLRWWTGKEAFVKAVGEGLSLPLDSFSVLVRAGGGMQLVGAGEGWWLRTFDPAPGYVGALVVRGARLRVSLRGWGASPEEAPQSSSAASRDTPG